MSRFRSSLSAALVAGTLLVVGGCADTPSAPAATDLRYEKVAAPAAPLRSLDGARSGVIGPQGGELATASGHRIVFPAGALPQPTEISIRDDAAYVGVHLEPHGIRFPAGRGPVLTLNLNGAETDGYEALAIGYVGDDEAIIEVLPAVEEGSTLTTRLQHFSGYITIGH